MTTPQLAGRSGGMTLIEVLVALAIVAVALAAGTRAAGALTQGTQRQASLVLAQVCAENELIKLRLSRVYPGAGEQTLICEQAGRSFGGRLSIATTPNPNFRRIDMRIFESPDANAHEVYRISTILSRY